MTTDAIKTMIDEHRRLVDEHENLVTKYEEIESKIVALAKEHKALPSNFLGLPTKRHRKIMQEVRMLKREANIIFYKSQEVYVTLTAMFFEIQTARLKRASND